MNTTATGRLPIRPISARALTTGYIVALLIIAGLSVGSHLTLEYSLRSNKGTAAVINHTGRQRMLSQRIASLAAQWKMGDSSAQEPLHNTINQFEAAHEFLIAEHSSGTADNRYERALRSIYFEGRNSLDQQVKSYIADARQIAAMQPDNPQFKQIITRIFDASREQLLVSLDNVVTIEQAESEQQIANFERLQWAILAVVLMTLVLEASIIFRPMIQKILEYTTALFHLATVDTLTGIANRRSFMDQAETELIRTRRYKRPACMLMLDIDHFKKVNDTYGYAAGDTVLAATGETLRQMLRQIDICGRLGGEEFAILLVETDLAGATIVAERIRQRFEEMTVKSGKHSIGITVSIGCAAIDPENPDLETALGDADRLLYRAKDNGRNQVMTSAAT